MAIPDLHIRHPRSKKDEWRKWANGLPKGKSFYASALALWPTAAGARKERLLQMVSHLIPEGADPSDEKVVQAAIDQKMAQLRAGRTAATYSSELQSLRRRGKTTQILSRVSQIYIRQR